MNSSNRFVDSQFTLLSLLPYLENAQLISKKQKMDDLYFTQKIVDLSIKALNAFLIGNLVAFDAQIGENLCQIRAYRILNLARKWLYQSNMKQELQKQLEHLIDYQHHLQNIVNEWEQAIQFAKTYNKNLDASEKSCDFFVRHNLVIDLNEEIVFIITCYFLTHFSIRDNQIPIAINLKQIAQELGISKFKAKRLSHHYQQLICKSGCDFIMQIADELPTGYGYQEMLPSLYKISDEDRAVLPCHLVSEILFNHALLEKIPVLFKINRFCESGSTHYDTIYFHLCGKEEDATQFSLIPCNPNSTQHCLIVAGVVHNSEPAENYIRRILNETPLKLILANTAIHPQYSGKRLESLKDNPFQAVLSDSNSSYVVRREKELASMQQFAIEAGCSKQNPTTFFLKHIYANTLLNEINELNSIHTGCAFKALEDQSLLLESIGQRYGKQESTVFTVV